MYTRPTAPLSIGEVLDNAFRLTAASLSRVWGFALIGSLIGLPAGLYQLTRAPADELFWLGDGTYWGLYALGMAGSLYAFSLICLRQNALVEGQDGPAPFGAAARRLPALLVAFVIYIVAMAIGGFLLLVPAVIFGISLAFNSVLILLEGQGPLDAIGGSHKLVWGNWWRTAGVLTVGIIIVFAIYFIIGIVFGILAPFMAGGDQVLATAISVTLVMVAVQIVATPFLTALLLTTYRDLKMRREGGDLMARAVAL